MLMSMNGPEAKKFLDDDVGVVFVQSSSPFQYSN